MFRKLLLGAALPLTLQEGESGVLYPALAIGFLVIGWVGAGVAVLLARRLTRPLERLRAVAEAFSTGDFARKAPLDSVGEIGRVARAMNKMAEELETRFASLKLESSRLEATLASMQEGVMAVDNAGTILHHNQAARFLFDIRIDPTLLKVAEVIRQFNIGERVGRVLRERVPEKTFVEIGSRVIGLRICPVGPTGGAVLVAHDATEDRRYDALRREFVANVSHELRTPISLIQAYVETLKEGAWKDPDRAPDFLATIEKQVRRLSAIVEDLLQLSRLESTGQIAKPEWIDLSPFLDRIQDAFRPLAEKKRQRFLVRADSGAERVLADPNLLERAVGNLVDNAIKYTPEAGDVRLRVQAEPGAVVFLVEDTGPGIPEKDRARIFERFYRVDKSRSRELGGTGLGLAIVKHIAQLHGGGVSVRSEPGAGCGFALRIPSEEGIQAPALNTE